MFASQLLRILQTIPSDVKYETCVYDSAGQDITMKENQNETLHGSKGFRREADPLAFESKEVYQLNGLRRDTHPSPFEVKGRDECWNPELVDDLSTDNQNGARDSAGEKLQNGLLYRLSSQEDDAYLLSSDPNSLDKMQSSTEHECSVAGEEYVLCNEKESRESRSPYIAASDLFEKDNNLFADKIVLECELPELIVCYKEINYHVVKDICVDEGMLVNRKFLTENSKDDQSDHCFPKPLNEDSHCKATGAVANELLVSDGLAATSLENTKGSIANEHGSKEESHGILLPQGRPESPPECSFDKDIAKDCDQEDSMQKGETKFSKTVAHVSEESFVDRTLPIQEFGTRSFLRSFLSSLDSEENKVKQPPDQIYSGKVVSEGRAQSPAEAGPKEDVQASRLYYDSKVETASITFNFNSLEPVVGGVANVRTENIKEQSVDSRNSLDRKDAGDDDLSGGNLVNCNSSRETSTEKIHEQSLNIKDGFASDISATSQASCISSKDMSGKNGHDQSLDIKDINSVDLSSSGLLPFANCKGVNSINSDGQAVDSHVLKPEHMEVLDNDSVVSLRKYDVGESSFSAAGIITYSGPIASSGSLSLRSDGSATSGRSFAFPILQPEWNASPVRMEKADRRHFRKHKGWRSGLLCCRF